MDYKKIIAELDSLLNVTTITSSNIGEVFDINNIKIQCIGTAGQTIKFKFIDNNKEIDIISTVINNKFISKIDKASLLSDEEIIDYLKTIDLNKINEIVNPPGTYGGEDVDSPLTINSYNNLNRSNKNDLKNLIRELKQFKRNTKIDDTFNK